MKVAFPAAADEEHRGEWFGSLGLGQLRVAETEKYPHVTFFFNDYRDEPWPGEERDNPQSPRVATRPEARHGRGGGVQGGG